MAKGQRKDTGKSREAPKKHRTHSPKCSLAERKDLGSNCTPALPSKPRKLVSKIGIRRPALTKRFGALSQVLVKHTAEPLGQRAGQVSLPSACR